MRTVNRIYIISTILLTISCTTKKTTNMSGIEFIPKEFNDVKLGYYERDKNPRSPGYPRNASDFLWNKIVINAPKKIICTNSNDTLVPVIPICGAYIITWRREMKHYDLVNMFHIRKINDENWLAGKIEDKDLQYEFPLLPPNYEEDQREIEKWRIEAQNYSDEELEEGQAGGGFFNLNLMEYINMPFEPGIYEIYVSNSGLESNRVKVEILFKVEKNQPHTPDVPGKSEEPKKMFKFGID